jgi:hypothetical protein
VVRPRTRRTPAIVPSRHEWNAWPSTNDTICAHRMREPTMEREDEACTFFWMTADGEEERREDTG